MEALLQRRITEAVGGSSGATISRGNQSREKFLNDVFANLSTEGTVALIFDLNAADEIVTERFTINGADGRAAMDMQKEIRRNAEQRNRDADSDFWYLD